jgi:hypothetical protein
MVDEWAEMKALTSENWLDMTMVELKVVLMVEKME